MVSLLGLAMLHAIAGAPDPLGNRPDRTPAGQVLKEAERAVLEGGLRPEPLTEDQLRAYPDARGMPADVQHFIVRWQDCNHWLGEPPWDEARARDIAEAVADICPGIDALGREVRARHADDPAVLARLADYDEIGQ